MPMLRRLGRAIAFAGGSLFLAMPAYAGKADDEARKIVREAMEEDYLATNMSAAVAKLRNALGQCDKGSCSKATLAKIHGSLGTVYSAGLSAHEDAVAEFRKMLEADPKAKPESAYITSDVQADFDRAKAGSGATPTPAASVGVLKERPWTEQATYSPVPVYVEVPEGTEATRVVVRYRRPSDKDWKELVLEKHKQGFGGYVPCAAVQKPGELLYFVTAFDANLDRVASAGSAEEPRKVKLTQAIKGRQPSLPGNVPPEQCPRPVQGLSCETNDDCPGAKVCYNLMCVEESSLEKPKKDEPEDKTPRKQNWLSLAYSADLTVVSGVGDACSAKAQRDATLSCFYSGGVQYDGIPATGNGNTLHGGVGLGSMRVLAGYDRLLGQRVTLGARLGFAFLGAPAREDNKKKFIPFHAEARGAYWIGKDPFAGKGVRPYVFANAGLADTSARLSTQVVEKASSKTTTLDVYKTSGPFFGGGGFGIQYAVSPEAAMVVELAGRAMFPDFAPVIAPSLGFAYGL